jgi:molybdopterin-binding protein
MAKKFYTDLDLRKNQLMNAIIHKFETDPLSEDLVAGQLWYNTTDNRLKYFNGLSIISLEISGGVDVSSFITASSTDTLTNKSIDLADGSGNTLSNVTVSNFAASAIASDVDTATSSQLVTGDVVKSYVEGKLASLGKLVGGHDASGGLLPTTGSGAKGAISSGDFYRVTTAGEIEGLGSLEVGDVIIANVDGAAAASDFFVLQANLTDTVSSTSNQVADMEIPMFDGTTGKIIKASGITTDANGNLNLPEGASYLINGVDITAEQPVKYSTEFAVADWVGESAPYSYTVEAETHLLGPTRGLSVYVRDADGAEVCVANTVSSVGTVVLQSNAKFDGHLMIGNYMMATANNSPLVGDLGALLDEING